MEICFDVTKVSVVVVSKELKYYTMNRSINK